MKPRSKLMSLKQRQVLTKGQFIRTICAAKGQLILLQHNVIMHVLLVPLAIPSLIAQLDALEDWARNLDYNKIKIK